MVMISKLSSANIQNQPLKQVQFTGNKPVQFGADFDPFRRTGRSSSSGGNEIKNFISKHLGLAGMALSALLAVTGVVSSYEKNKPGEVSVLVHKWGGGSERNEDGSIRMRDEGAVWKLPFGLDSNYKYTKSVAELRDTINPHAQDGVVINGSGDIDDGVDIRLGYKLRAGELYPEGHPKQWQPIDPKILEESVGKIHSLLVGSSTYNPEYINETGVSSPIFNEDGPKLSTQFMSGDATMQKIYFSLILPKVQRAIKVLAINSKAEDIHTQRQFISDGLQNGWTQYKLNSDGSRRLEDKDGKPVSVIGGQYFVFKDGKNVPAEGVQPIVAYQLPPLAKELEPLGIELMFVQTSDIDTPEQLWTHIDKIGQIPQEIINLSSLREQYMAQQLSRKSEIGVLNNKLLEEAHGQGKANVAKKQGELEQAIQDKLAKEQEAMKYHNQEIAKANGDAQIIVSKAKEEAVKVVQSATGTRDAKVAEADGKATYIRVTGLAEAESLARRGEAFSKFPEMYEKLATETNAEIRKMLASKYGFVLVSPETPIDGIITQIGQEEFKLVPKSTK